MTYALAKEIKVDCFVVITDNETYAGRVHPTVALQQYRNKMNPKAKLVVCGLTSTGFSIADPQDAGQLDCVGFDTSVPAVISDFARR
jgi:60 kDa SS-A/Ro ribonucleoprotein